jgi:multidrug resistance efflux pump
MSASFPRTLAALRTDRGRTAVLAGALGLLLLAGWTGWLGLARVSVYRTSSRARLEVMPAPARVAATVGGRVLRVNLRVGQKVSADEVLVELEATPEHIALERTRARLAALEPELGSLARELAAEDQATARGDAADRAALRETLARQRAADAALSLAEEEERRIRSLVEAAGAAPSALSHAASDLRQKRAVGEAIAHESATLEADRQERDASRRARREQLERQHVELASSIAVTRAEVNRLAYEQELRVLRAPVAGTLGEVSPVQPGAVLSAGEIIATVVPNGELQVVAMYAPDAIGRIAPRQRAQVKLDGFPWTHYGTVAARVTRVGNELREGTFRVELALAASQRIPLRHGMTGSVDIEIERASPSALLVRALGRQNTPATGRD